MIEAQLLRLAPYLIALAGIAWLSFVVVGWKHDAEQLPKVTHDFDIYRTGVETAARVRKEVSDEYQSELATLRAGRDAAPARTVRLCSNPQLPSTPGATIGDYGSAPGAWTLPQVAGPGPDIGGRLYSHADEADEVSARLRACQAFVVKLQQVPK